MYNFFKKFDDLLGSAKADVYYKLKNNNVRYKELLKENGENYNRIMEKVSQEKSKKEYCELMTDYLYSNLKKHDFEDKAMYIRGFCDCIGLMSEFGDIMGDDFAKNMMKRL